MSVKFCSEKNIFHLKTKTSSYIFRVMPNKVLNHLYWGKAVREYVNFEEVDYNPDSILAEYPEYGRGDFRDPAYQIEFENGRRLSELKYVNHNIYYGKKSLVALPSTYAEKDTEVESLEIILKDDFSSLEVILTYSVYEEYDAITRNVKFVNKGNESVQLNRALSLCVDFETSDFELLHLSGAWCREKHIFKRELQMGSQAIESKRGISSHQHNPFVALLSKGATETIGDVYGFSLVYSGNFLANVEVDGFKRTRVVMGINPFDFAWEIREGESFQTPEGVLVYSDKGLGKMSRIYHKLYRERLSRGKYRDKTRPILINNWEATYFNFNADKIVEIAKAGKELGIELFVLDDGWFGKRDSDNSSLGDWFEDRRKLPKGLKDLAENVNKEGLSFGLWFEPEMLSPDSDLYKEHPDWCLHVEGIKPMSGRFQRNQLVLDLTRKEVREEIIKRVSDILREVPISYVKWDMNRALTDVGSIGLSAKNQKETFHRYVLGLYEMLERITGEFPEVLFENCSSGGARFDPGMSYYMPQTWASDDTDAVERLKIQYGTSIVYPVSSIGSHASTIPNHQVSRMEKMETRGLTAMMGIFGYELDLTKLPEEDRIVAKEHVALFKEIRETVQFGEFYRLLSPFEGNETAWMFVNEKTKEVLVFYFKVLAEPYVNGRKLKLQGLNPEQKYLINDKEELYGDQLMNIGLDIKNEFGDFRATFWRIKMI